MRNRSLVWTRRQGRATSPIRARRPHSITSYAMISLAMIARKPWTYGCDIKSRDYLKREESFESLVHEFAKELAVVNRQSVRFRMEPTNGKYSGDDPLLKRLQCMRASWTIPLGSVLLDKFFNGRMGIRAQYYASPYHGSSMNRRLLSTLHNRLVELAREGDPSLDKDLLELSLTAPSAKAWISEKNLMGHKIIRASDLKLAEEELQNDWLDLARAVKNGAIGNEQFQLYSAAINGVHAPMADQFEVKGAWITHLDRCEYVTPDKRDRDCQLFLFGFT